MAFIQSVNPKDLYSVFGTSCIDLINRVLGGKIVSCSDEWFAEAANLINPAEPIQQKGKFVSTGAWYDGWETRRHNKEPMDWVVIKLGVASGVVHGVEIDTSFFDGNHAPSVSVEGCFLENGRPSLNTTWDVILPQVECGPSMRFIWKLPVHTPKAYSHVRLNMYPDGGIARFRLYGTVVPLFPSDTDAIIDLAHVSSGALAIESSDQHFGTKDNLLLPGRGTDMSDGWETKRSRTKGHVDWVIIKLGTLGIIREVVVDTLHFRGNFPQAVEIYVLRADEHEKPGYADRRWEKVVGPYQCAADMEHSFPLPAIHGVEEKAVNHVKMVIIPDGGVKRLRVFGKRVLVQ